MLLLLRRGNHPRPPHDPPPTHIHTHHELHCNVVLIARPVHLHTRPDGHRRYGQVGDYQVLGAAHLGGRGGQVRHIGNAPPTGPSLPPRPLAPLPLPPVSLLPLPAAPSPFTHPTPAVRPLAPCPALSPRPLSPCQARRSPHPGCAQTAAEGRGGRKREGALEFKGRKKDGGIMGEGGRGLER